MKRGEYARNIENNNKNLLYLTIKKMGTATISELENITNLSHPTVTSQIRSMVQEDILKVSGRKLSTGGRSAMRYSLNLNRAYAVGVDIEFPMIRLAISNLGGDCVAWKSYLCNIADDPKAILEKMCKHIELLLQRNEITKDKLLGIGIGLPGIIDYKRTFSLNIDRVNKWCDVEVGEILKDKFNTNIILRNDVYALAYAERKLYATENEGMLFVALRSGIGASIQIGSKAYIGERGNAGYFGHTIVVPNGRLCKCGQKGCLEKYAGKQSMLEAYFDRSGQKLENISKLLDRALNKYDMDAKEVIEQAVGYLTIGIGNIIKLFDISKVVVSADFETQYIVSLIQKTLNQEMRFNYEREIKVVSANLRKNEFALGGCFLVLTHYKDILK